MRCERPLTRPIRSIAFALSKQIWQACISELGATCSFGSAIGTHREVPARWLRADSRASLLTGAPRAATSPLNAMRNYLFACLESEARLALLAHGLDPSIGAMHRDQRNRDSMALDCVEPVRGDVDDFLLDLLEDRVFSVRDFGELPNGVCRIAAPLTHELALTLPHWRGLVQPIAARLAQLFRNAATGANDRRPASMKSALLATPRKAAQYRPYASKAWSIPRLESPPSSAAACGLCGEPVLKRRRRHCDACIPQGAPGTRPASDRSRSKGARSPSRRRQRPAR